MSKDNLARVVRKGTFVRHEFMEVVDKEVNYVWNEAKKKSQEKVMWNIKKHKDSTPLEKGMFKGVFVGDLELKIMKRKS